MGSNKSQLADTMATSAKEGAVTFSVSTLVASDTLSNLLIEKDLITGAEYMEKLSEDRATYQAMMQKMGAD